MNKIINYFIASPLTLCGNTMKEKLSDKYLGNYIHTEGPGALVKCTIDQLSIQLNSTKCRVIMIIGVSHHHHHPHHHPTHQELSRHFQMT